MSFCILSTLHIGGVNYGKIQFSFKFVFLKLSIYNKKESFLSLDA